MRQQHSFYWFSFQHQEEKSSSEEVQKCVNYHKVTFNLNAPSWNRSSQSMHYGLLIHLDKMDHWRFVIFCTHAGVRLHCAVLDAFCYWPPKRIWPEKVLQYFTPHCPSCWWIYTLGIMAYCTDTKVSAVQY